MAKYFYTVLIIAVISIAAYYLFFFGYWFSITHSSNEENPSCATHEKGRISFSVKNKNVDLEKMIGSFQRSHSEYVDSLAITNNHGNINDYICCCIDYEKVVSFASNPQEIYTINFDEYNEQLGFIDIVSTYRNGKWQGSLTSKLDSSEKQRVRKRFYTEILSKLH